MKRNLLVLDVGTTSAKAVIFDPAGAVVSAASRPVETVNRPDGTREQSTRQWWDAITQAVRLLDGRNTIGAIVLTGSMQNLAVVTSDGALADRAILYSDARIGRDDLAALAERLPADFAALTGNPLDAASVLARIAHFARFFPDIDPGAVRSFLFGAKDALIYRMTGRAVTDPTTATTTGLMDFVGRLWNERVLAAAAVDRSRLPDLLPATAVVGRLAAQAAAEFGVKSGVPVYNGAGDAAAATWGAFANGGNAAYCYLGTTGWVATTVDDRTALNTDVYRLAEPVFIRKTIAISSFLSAGAAFSWLSGCVSAEAAALAAGAEARDSAPPSLMFLPFLSGERGPFDDRAVRAAFLGIDGSHGPADLAYAVMEGIAHAVRHNLESLNPVEGPLTMIGGGAERLLQRQLVADVLGRPVAFGEASALTPAFGLYRMIAPLLDFAGPGETQRQVLPPRSDRCARADQRYAAYLDATAFARRHGRNLADPPVPMPARVAHAS